MRTGVFALQRGCVRASLSDCVWAPHQTNNSDVKQKAEPLLAVPTKPNATAFLVQGRMYVVAQPSPVEFRIRTKETVLADTPTSLGAAKGQRLSLGTPQAQGQLGGSWV